MKPTSTTFAPPTPVRARLRAWTCVAMMRGIDGRGIVGALDSILH
jgi:hypothetical protein